VDLYFICPIKNQGFWSAAWRPKGRLQVLEDGAGGRRLAGLVEVDCPLCGRKHDFKPEEIACPLTAPERG